nr:immunoglobulin light chain junction region [Macaca mulatta]
CMIWHNNAYIC